MFSDVQIQAAAAIRRQIHAYPELMYAEHQTAALAAGMLRELGYAVTEGIAGTGVLAVLDSGRPGPVIALRADMDALPVDEADGLPYRSKVPGKMHACGHDGHTAALLLAAREIIARKDRLCGTVKLIFQPAEEGGNGAEKMVNAGVLKGPDVQAVFGFHNRPGFESGMVFAKSGSAMGGNDTYDLTIFGQSGHSAMPHLAADPIYAGAAIVMQLQGIVARRKSPLLAGVITVSSFQSGGAADNVIPQQAKLVLNIRSDSEASRLQLVSQLEALAAGVCKPFGADFELVHRHHVPPLVNSPEETKLVIEAARRVLPNGHSIMQIDYMPTMGAEDFAFYLQEVPGCFFFVGNGLDSAYLHNASYDFNDDILPVAAAVFVGIAEMYCLAEG